MNVEPIGIVRGLESGERQGAIAPVAIEASAGDAARIDLTRFEAYSHVLLTGWPEEGRSGRLATCAARIIERDAGRLVVDGVKWPEGTAVFSVEGYSPADFSVFSARDGHELSYPADGDEATLLGDLIAEAAQFHGERCAGVILGAKIMLHVMKTWQVGQKDAGLRLWLGSDGCIADALIALSGVTLGTGRLKVPGGRIYRFVRGDKGLAYYPTEEAFAPAVDVLARNVEELFAIREETERQDERKPSHEKRPPRRNKKEEALVRQVVASLVDGKLSCAMAYKIADEMGVHVSEVGRAADKAIVKISYCQLGCFH